MSCTVQCVPTLDVNIAHLLDRLNSTVEVSIDGGQFGAQQELPLNSAGVSEAEEGDLEDDDEAETERQLAEAARGLEAPKRRGRPRKANGSGLSAH